MDVNLDNIKEGEYVNVIYKDEIIASFEKNNEQALVLLYRLREDNPAMKLTWSEDRIVELKIY